MQDFICIYILRFIGDLNDPGQMVWVLWVLDIVFHDDENRAREKNEAANSVTLKHVTLNMLKSLQGKQSMRVRNKLADGDEEYLYKALCATPA